MQDRSLEDQSRLRRWESAEAAIGDEPSELREFVRLHGVLAARYGVGRGLMCSAPIQIE